MDTRHQSRPPLESLVILPYQTPRLGIQRAVRIGLNQQTPYYHQNIPYCQLGIPVSLQRLHAYPAGLGVDVRVKYWGAEVCRGRLQRIIGWQREVKFEDAGGKGGVGWAGEEDVKAGEVVGGRGVRGEEVVGWEGLAV